MDWDKNKHICPDNKYFGIEKEYGTWLQQTILDKNIDPRVLAKESGIPKYHIDLFRKSESLPNRFQMKKIQDALGIKKDEHPAFPSSKSNQSLLRRHTTELNPEKVDKPSKKKKPSKIQNHSRIHDIKVPEMKHCRKCGIEKGSECFRHAESRIIKFLAGGGITGGKIPDTLSAWMCYECNEEMSEPLDKTASWQQERSHALDWALVILKTWNI